MARLARFIAPGIAYHVTQRGNGRQQLFFGADDCAAYRELLAAQCAAHGVAVWSWVLMPNHVHLILVPDHSDALLDPVRGDGLTDTAPVLERVADFAGLLRAEKDEALFGRLRRSECPGRPLGDGAFLDQVEALLGHDPKPGKRGPKPKAGGIDALSP